MAHTHTQYPTLNQGHIADGAGLYATRRDMVYALAPRGGTAIELGVMHGDFSEFILETLEPAKFYGADLFRMHEEPIIWGRPSSELFDNMTQIDFYRKRFAKYGDRFRALQGPSADLMEEFPDETFDFIYIDAGHDYENVRKDADVSARKLKRDGLIVFNDYTLMDVFSLDPYGIVQAVNEMVATGDWKICGFALEHNMFCDIAVKRA